MGAPSERIVLSEGWEGAIYREWSFPPEVIETWNALALRYGDSGIFISHGFFENWWKAFGNTAGELLLLILKKDGEIKAIFPCCLQAASIGGKSNHFISSLTNDHSCYYDFIVDSEFRQAAIPHFVRLIRMRYPGFQLCFDKLHASCENISMLLMELRREWMPASKYQQPWSPWINVSGDCAGFYNKLSGGLRNNLRRYRKRAEADGKLCLEIIQKSDRLDEVLDTVFEIEGNSWKRATGTAIKCKTEVESYYRQLAGWAMEHDQLLIFLLKLGDKPIAGNYCLCSGKTVFQLKTGCLESFKKLSPGKLIHDEIIKYLFQSQQVEIYDFMGHPDSWKKEWTKNSYDYCSLRAFPKSLTGWSEYTMKYGWKDCLKRFHLVQNILLLRNQKDVKSTRSSPKKALEPAKHCGIGD